MADENETKEDILTEAVAAAMKGINSSGQKFDGDTAESAIRAHWSEQYDIHQAAIESTWNDVKAKALGKAEAIGVRAAEIAIEGGKSTIDSEVFETAVSEINSRFSKQGYSEWC